MDSQPQHTGVKLANVTVYGKPGCRACKSTTRKFDKHGIDYEYVDFTVDTDAYENVIVPNGVLAAPYVVAPNGSWSGLNEEKIEELVGA